MNQKRELSVKEEQDGSKKLIGKFYQGIIPSPEMMKEYQEIDPTIPGRLIKWMEDESTKRRKLEQKVINHAFITTILGNTLGFLAIIALGFLSYLFMKEGHASDGKWIAISIAGVVGIFVIRKYMTEKD